MPSETRTRRIRSRMSEVISERGSVAAFSASAISCFASSRSAGEPAASNSERRDRAAGGAGTIREGAPERADGLGAIPEAGLDGARVSKISPIGWAPDALRARSRARSSEGPVLMGGGDGEGEVVLGDGAVEGCELRRRQREDPLVCTHNLIIAMGHLVGASKTVQKERVVAADGESRGEGVGRFSRERRGDRVSSGWASAPARRASPEEPE